MILVTLMRFNDWTNLCDLGDFEKVELNPVAVYPVGPRADGGLPPEVTMMMMMMMMMMMLMMLTVTTVTMMTMMMMMMMMGKRHHPISHIPIYMGLCSMVKRKGKFQYRLS